MTPDPEYLRQHYAALTDEALMEIDRADLVEVAQSCFDNELRQRKLLAQAADVQPAPPRSPKPVVARPKAREDSPTDNEKPEWLDEAAEVLSRADSPSTGPADTIVDARDALEAAGIPCYLDLFETPAEPTDSPRPTHAWRLMVPGDFNQRATSVLERDIFNADFEAEWKAQLETLSDDELAEMNPQDAFCGLFDRVERVTRVFDQELTRRRLK